MFHSSNLFETIDYKSVYKEDNINKQFYQNFLFLFFLQSYEQQFLLFLMKKWFLMALNTNVF